MSNKGIEDSVASIFKLQLQSWCNKNGVDDLTFDMNGSDRAVNADTMFSVCDRFFLIEMKSKENNIKDEAAKPAVCLLCTGLKLYADARNLHRECHYIMWGTTLENPPRVDTFYTIYEDSVCRPEVLPDCQGVTTPAQRIVMPGIELACRVANGLGGLTGSNFFPYLAWLLGNRNGPTSSVIQTDSVPIALVGSSAKREVFGKLFQSYEELNIWGADALKDKLNRQQPSAYP